jgi:hypothetical protein
MCTAVTSSDGLDMHRPSSGGGSSGWWHQSVCSKPQPAPHPHPPTRAAWQVIPEGPDGRICLASLEEQLKAHQHCPLRIGSFSAGSNVTGGGAHIVAQAGTLIAPTVTEHTVCGKRW